MFYLNMNLNYSLKQENSYASQRWSFRFNNWAFLSVTLLLSSRSLVQSQFIDELESIFVTLKKKL